MTAVNLLYEAGLFVAFILVFMLIIFVITSFNDWRNRR